MQTQQIQNRKVPLGWEINRSSKYPLDYSCVYSYMRNYILQAEKKFLPNQQPMKKALSIP
jgi:hypothetical protein